MLKQQKEKTRNQSNKMLRASWCTVFFHMKYRILYFQNIPISNRFISGTTDQILTTLKSV